MSRFPTIRTSARNPTLVFLYLLSILQLAACQLTGACQRPVLNTFTKVPTTGQVNASVIFIDFPDAPSNGSAKALLATLPLAGITDFLNQSSFEQLELNITAYADRFYHMPKASNSYGYGVPLTTDALLAYASDALAAVGKNISFEDTQLLFIVPPPSSSIPFSTSSSVPLISASGHTISGLVSLGIDAYYKAVRIDYTIASLVARNLGLRTACPPSTGQGAGDQNMGGFSPFCIQDPLVPDFFAEQKWTLGWLDGETQVICVERTGNSSDTVNRTLILSAVEVAGDATTPQTKLAVMSLPGGLSLYAEARTQKGLDKDACLSGEGAGGVLLYYALATSEATMTDPIYIINPQSNPLYFNDDVILEDCAHNLAGFLAPLGLAPNQFTNYTIPNTGIRVTVLSQNEEEGTFEVRFESHVQDTASTTTSASSTTTNSITSTSTAGAEATRGPGAANVMTLAMIPGVIHIAFSLW